MLMMQLSDKTWVCNQKEANEHFKFFPMIKKMYSPVSRSAVDVLIYQLTVTTAWLASLDVDHVNWPGRLKHGSGCSSVCAACCGCPGWRCHTVTQGNPASLCAPLGRWKTPENEKDNIWWTGIILQISCRYLVQFYVMMKELWHISFFGWLWNVINDYDFVESKVETVNLDVLSSFWH